MPRPKIADKISTMIPAIKKFPIYMLTLLCLPAIARTDLSYQESCGVFKILGTVKDSPEKKLVVVVNEGTKSEITLGTPKQNELKFLAYKNRPLVGEFEVTTKINGTSGEISKLIKIDYRTNSPINTEENTSIKLIKKMKCQK